VGVGVGVGAEVLVAGEDPSGPHAASEASASTIDIAGSELTR
jgi:hypothetical protein